MALSTSRLLLRSPLPPPPPPKPYPKTLIPNTIAIAPAGFGTATPRNPFSVPGSPNRRAVSASAASSSSWAAGDLRPAIDENPEGIISGEWPENIYLLGYDDLRAYLESQIISSDKVPFDLLLFPFVSRVSLPIVKLFRDPLTFSPFPSRCLKFISTSR